VIARCLGALTAVLSLLAPWAGEASAAGGSALGLVNPFVGTESGAADFGTGGGAGNTFPGAAVPFGMVQLSPDTIPSDDNFAGGYTYSDSALRGFSLTHFSGAGCAQFQDIPFLPTTADVTEAPTARGSSAIKERYVASFSHDHEDASPGSYEVTLDPGTAEAITAELTASQRVGAMRLAYPRGAPANLLVNAGGSAMANGDAVLRVDPGRREISGFVESGRFCYNRNSYRVHFVARFNRDFARHGTWRDEELAPGSTETSDRAENPLNYQPVPGGPPSVPGDPTSGALAGAYVGFEPRGQPVQARIGVSFTDLEGARANLAAEGDEGFGKTRKAAEMEWERALGKVRVDGGTKRERRTFYTALYHSLLHPSLFSDADGRYAGMDGEAHRVASGARYANFSGWDIYRTQVPLLAMLFPGRADDMAASLVANAEESGCLPRWPVADGQTSVMVGDPSAPMIAAADAFGARELPRRAALSAMLRGAREPCETKGRYVQREALDDYLRLGYVPHERNSDVFTHNLVDPSQPWGSAATTLEYGIADHAISRFAMRLGDTDAAAELARRSGAWAHLLDPSTLRATSRLATGPFLPAQGPASEDGFVEGSSEQYTWLVPHDVGGLIEAIGGEEAAASRLDAFFSELNGGPDSPHAFLGNEPTLGTPWIYAWLGRPDRTREVVRRALSELYAPTPGGMPGNDDGGAMSAWYVLASIGLYPAIPGEDVLLLGTPAFDRAELDVRGRMLTLRSAGAGEEPSYVREASLDEEPLTRSWVRFAELRRGRDLRLRMGPAAGRWGSDPADAPPSFAAEGR
jgi:predicted alpha-1,2-mannosidase